MKKFNITFGVCMTLFLLSACSTSITKNSSKLDISSLEEVKSNNMSGREFKPVSIDLAITALPFEAKFPKTLPFLAEESDVTIGDWESNLEKIVYSITYNSKEEEQVHIQFIVANFDRYFSSIKENNEYEEITLEDGTVAFFRDTDFPSSELHWLNDGIEYNLHYNFVFNDDNKEKAELLEIANSLDD